MFAHTIVHAAHYWHLLNNSYFDNSSQTTYILFKTFNSNQIIDHISKATKRYVIGLFFDIIVNIIVFFVFLNRIYFLNVSWNIWMANCSLPRNNSFTCKELLLNYCYLDLSVWETFWYSSQIFLGVSAVIFWLMHKSIKIHVLRETTLSNILNLTASLAINFIYFF